MVSKVFSGTWLVVLLAIVLIVSMYMLQLTWWIPFFYSLLLIFIPLIMILKKLKEARQPEQFHNVSTYIKVVMFTGILSMAVIGFHH